MKKPPWHASAPRGAPRSGGGTPRRVLRFLLGAGGTLVSLLPELNCSRETRGESSKMPSCVEHNAQLQQTELDKMPAAGSTVIYCFEGKIKQNSYTLFKVRFSPSLSSLSLFGYVTEKTCYFRSPGFTPRCAVPALASREGPGSQQSPRATASEQSHDTRREPRACSWG